MERTLCSRYLYGNVMVFLSKSHKAFNIIFGRFSSFAEFRGNLHLSKPTWTQTLPLLTIYVWDPEILSCMEIYFCVGTTGNALSIITRRDGQQVCKRWRQIWEHQTQNAVEGPLGMSASAPHFCSSMCSQVLLSWKVATRQWRGRWKRLELHKFFQTTIRDTHIRFLKWKWTAKLASVWI